MSKKQMSETIWIGILLAFAGGFLDAYTYIMRDGVFANAQTGNMVLFGVHIAAGNYGKAFAYFIPILAFFVGILVAEWIKEHFKKSEAKIHWRQIIVALECVTLCVVGFLPQSCNMAANVAVSFVCSMQVESFRKVNGNPYATTMCTGNLRSATENLYHYKNTRDKKKLHNSLQYFSIILFFIVGGGIGSILCKQFAELSVLFAALVLALTVLCMCRRHV